MAFSGSFLGSFVKNYFPQANISPNALISTAQFQQLAQQYPEDAKNAYNELNQRTNSTTGEMIALGALAAMGGAGLYSSIGDLGTAAATAAPAATADAAGAGFNGFLADDAIGGAVTTPYDASGALTAGQITNVGTGAAAGVGGAAAGTDAAVGGAGAGYDAGTNLLANTGLTDFTGAGGLPGASTGLSSLADVGGGAGAAAGAAGASGGSSAISQFLNPQTIDLANSASTAVASGGGTSLSSLLTPSNLLSAGQAVSGLVNANAAKDAANIQANAANNATNAQLSMFNTLNDQAAPYRQAGYGALSEIGANQDYFDHQFGAADLNANLAPNWQFALQQGQGAATNALNATGGLGGNFAKGLVDYTTSEAGNQYQNAFNNYTANQSNIYNRLSNLAGLGNAANSTTASAGASISPGVANTIQGAGQANASGVVGQANAITSGLNNAASWYALPQILNSGLT